MNSRQNQNGALNVLLLPFIFVTILFIGVAVFAYWAYGSRQDYKNNVDAKISVAVAQSVKSTEASDAAIYLQKEKYPLATYNGPSSFGGITAKYPKTWSGYVAEESQSNTPIEGYFYPSIVPDVTNEDNSYALRIELMEQSYSTSMANFTSEVQQGTLKVSPYTLPKLPNVIGSYLQGQISENKQGTMVVVPLLNMTLEIWTESSQFQSDFNNIILPNITFQP